jgi:hypothetical protein
VFVQQVLKADLLVQGLPMQSEVGQLS